jgi:hypothetical protein
MELVMQRALMCLVAGTAFTWATIAAADTSQLYGEYAFTGTTACLVAPGGVGGATPLPNPTPGVALPGSGFDSRLVPNDAETSFTRSFSVEGIRTFDGNGHGTVKATLVAILPGPTPGPNGFPHFGPTAAAADFSFQFTYVVNPDRSWTSTMVAGTYTETWTAGPRTGQTATVDAIPPFAGAVSSDGRTLIAAYVAPTVETHIYSNGDVWPQICHRSRVFIKVKDSGDDRGQDH